jgi:N-acetylglucosamine-6-phosphate deacetylase
MQAAVQRGLRQSTHTYHAMRPLGHREPGTVGAALTMPEIACELIADNIHVHPAAIKLLVEAKGPAGVILITDAVRVAGLPEGDYQLDDRMVSVRAGAVRLANGGLAGSTLTMDRALRNLRAATGRPLRELWPAASLNAARAIGVSTSKGSLELGKDADLVLLDAEGRVCLTVAAGEVVYTNA